LGGKSENQKIRAQSGGKKTMAAFNECKLIRVKYNRQQTTTRSQQSQQSAISGRWRSFGGLIIYD